MPYYGLIEDLDAILLDNRVGQYLMRNRFDVFQRLLSRDPFGEGNIEGLALADVRDRPVAQPVKRRADRLPLRIQHGGLKGNQYASFHGNLNYRTPLLGTHHVVLEVA